MSRLRVLDLVRALDAKVLSEGELGTRRIHDVSVCAQSVPGVLSAIAEGRLVVTPGDRLDVIMATCLKAVGGVRLAALLLTAGIQPDPAVWELTAAARATGLPVLLLDEPTYETANAVHGLSTEVAFDDAERAELVMNAVADSLDETWLRGLVDDTHGHRLSPAAFRHRITTKARAAHKRIVLPEGAEPRTLLAAAMRLAGQARRDCLADKASRPDVAGRRHCDRSRRGGRTLRRALRRAAQAQGRDH
jgi:phosphate acetyltransferase